MLFSCPQKQKATGFTFKPNWIKENRVTHSTVTQSTHGALSASVLNEFYHSLVSFDALLAFYYPPPPEGEQGIVSIRFLI